MTQRNQTSGRIAMDIGLVMTPSRTGTADMAQGAERMGIASLVCTDTQYLTPEVWNAS